MAFRHMQSTIEKTESLAVRRSMATNVARESNDTECGADKYVRHHEARRQATGCMARAGCPNQPRTPAWKTDCFAGNRSASLHSIASTITAQRGPVLKHRSPSRQA
jgi:hypothetical protein